MKVELLYIVGVIIFGLLGVVVGATLGNEYIAQMTGGLAVALSAYVGVPIAKWGEQHGLV